MSRPVDATELLPLKFTPNTEAQPYRAHQPKIGWMRTIANKPGASFDIVIKDIHGRERVRRNNCKSDTEQFGELINHPVMLGEQLNVEISNLKGADSVDVYLT